MESNSAAIQAHELTKKFGAFTAVDQISVEVRRGELFGLLGPNGAGKTTLTRMLTTLIGPTSGSAQVAGEDVVRAPGRVRERIGVIPQALTSDLDLTGWENVDIYGEFYGVGRRQRHERAARHSVRLRLSPASASMIAVKITRKRRSDEPRIRAGSDLPMPPVSRAICAVRPTYRRLGAP
ncbi:MAG: ATP-binding cassette domain-containing protein [Candidatus Binataceae bacterium]|nr:ATP-binding cassette domain-containing protein [Candidatus Binataceae bacterium]